MSESSLSPGSPAVTISPSPAAIQAIERERKRYLVVYAVLILGTILTVAMYYVHFDEVWQMVSVALLIAAVKAAFVASIFMHLWHGQRDIYRILFFTGVFAATMLGFLTFSLFSLPGMGHYLK